MPKTVEIAVLHMGWNRYELTNELLRMQCDERYKVIIGFSSAVPQMNNHNISAKRFLERDPPADYLLILGDDSRPRGNLLDLVEKDLDVVGFPHPIGKWTTQPDDPIIWNLVTLEGSSSAVSLDDDLIEVASIGSGAMLIARRVLEHPAMRAPFMDEWDEDGIRSVGGDLTFCFRAREAGFEVWAALSHLCGHIKEVDLGLIYALLKKSAKDRHYYDDVYVKIIENPAAMAAIEERIKVALNHAIGSVLDLGCGLGQAANMMEQNYIGVDFSAFAVEYARNHNENVAASFMWRDITDLSPDVKQADTVLLLEVLEHVEDRETLAQTALSLARQRVIITVPVNMPDPGHIKPRWTKEDLEALFGDLAVCKQFGKWWLAVKKL